MEKSSRRDKLSILTRRYLSIIFISFFLSVFTQNILRSTSKVQSTLEHRDERLLVRCRVFGVEHSNVIVHPFLYLVKFY